MTLEATMRDTTDHNCLAAQFNERFVEQRVREIAAFEARANGEVPNHHTAQRRPPTALIQQEKPSMSIFETARPTSAYLKMGIMGKQGSGKSYTAAEVAIGLINHLKEIGVDYAEKPAAFFDTET